MLSQTPSTTYQMASEKETTNLIFFNKIMPNNTIFLIVHHFPKFVIKMYSAQISMEFP